jgi:3'-phosphoadenosine 5'-phosphosulfate sulfotransferase (PAPS reductase)/FAD synthetase
MSAKQSQFDVLPGMPDALSKKPPKAREYEGMILDQAIAKAHAILDEAIATYPAERIMILLSGGNDSIVFAHLLRQRADMIVYINTGTGIPATREHVKAVADFWRLPYVEAYPPDSYEDLVCGRVTNENGEVVFKGFPGPGKHGLMYQRLKERALDNLRRTICGKRGKTGQLVFLAGMRWGESDRRFRNAEEIDPDGAVVWCSPIVGWTEAHMREYRERYRCRLDHEHADHMLCGPDALPLNEVTVHLHRSGDCNCGAYAQEGEIHGIELFYPETAAYLHELEVKAKAAGAPERRCQWGWGAGKEPAGPAGRLCRNCAPPAPIDGQIEFFATPTRVEDVA